MKIKNFKILLLIATVLFSVNGLVFAQSSPFTIVDLPATGTDAAIDINTSKTYTHAFDFGMADEATINDVEFLSIFYVDMIAPMEDTSPQGYGYVIDDSRETVGIAAHEGNDDVTTMADGNSAALLRDMIYFSKATVGDGILLTLKDLVPGTKYSFRYYYRPWDPDITRPITFKFDGPEDSVFVDTIRVDIDEIPGSHYLDYTYIADDDDKTILFVCNDDNQGVHLYGITNEVLESTGIDSKASAKPSTFGLMQNYPNPFNPTTNIQFQIPNNEYVTLKVFNSVGQQVATLVDSNLRQGVHNVTFDASELPSGVYFYNIKAGDFMQTKKMLLLK